MAGCIDERFEKMLHAYEMGVLPDEERRALEIHLLECEHCMQSVREFQEPARLLRHDREIRTAIKKIVEEHPETGELPSGKIRIPFWRRMMPRLVPATVVALLALIVLILKPWQIEIRPTQEAVAVPNRLAIMYFENLSDQQDAGRLGEIVADLLITDLSESQYMQIVSSQRLYDILRLVGLEGEKKIDRDVASMVAERARARWMLVGNFLQMEPQIILTSQLVDVKTGDVMASQKISGAPGEDIFAAVDKLSREVKKDLSLPPAAQQEPDRQVAHLTTNSLEAYRHYLEGMEYFHKYYFLEAEEELRKALEIDSSFAFVYMPLIAIKISQNNPETVVLIKKALKYADKVTLRERYYINSMAAFLSKDYTRSKELLQKLTADYPDDKSAYHWLGWLTFHVLNQPEEAVHYFNKAIEIDSLYKNPYEQLASIYTQLGDSIRAAKAMEAYFSLTAGEAWPYHRQGTIHLRNGRINQAIQSFEKAIALKPDFYPTLERLSRLYLNAGDYDKAEKGFRKLASRPEPNLRSDARTDLALVPMYQGKFDEALGVLDNGISVDSVENTLHGEEGDMANKHLLKAMAYRDKGDLNAAIAEIKMSMDICRQVKPVDTPCYLDDYVWLLAESGDISTAKQMAEELKKQLEEVEKPSAIHWYAIGQIELAKENFDAAAELFKKAFDTTGNLYDQFMLATVHLKAGQYESAVDIFERLLSRSVYWYRYGAVLKIKALYYLGLTYEKSGEVKKAAENYEKFLAAWKNADPGILEVKDAARRLELLRDR
jgi:tetratricopeptide (TPR) repeat protein